MNPIHVKDLIICIFVFTITAKGQINTTSALSPVPLDSTQASMTTQTTDQSTASIMSMMTAKTTSKTKQTGLTKNPSTTPTSKTSPTIKSITSTPVNKNSAQTATPTSTIAAFPILMTTTNSKSTLPSILPTISTPATATAPLSSITTTTLIIPTTTTRTTILTSTLTNGTETPTDFSTTLFSPETKSSTTESMTSFETTTEFISTTETQVEHTTANNYTPTTQTLARASCPVNLTRPDVGINEECGEHSISGICAVTNSFCSQTDNATLWICVCGFGYVQQEYKTCKKIPDALFSTTSDVWSMYTANIYKEFDLIKINDFNVTNSSLEVLGRYLDYCEAKVNIDTQSLHHNLSVKCTNPWSLWRYDITICVTVTVETVIIRDCMTIIVLKESGGFYEELTIMDGTPQNTMVGQITQFTNAEHDTLHTNHSLLYIGAFGIIYTNMDIDLIKNRTIAYSQKIPVFLYNYSFPMGQIRATIIQKRFFANPMLEDSLPTAVIGYFDVDSNNTIDVINTESFCVFNSSILQLGSTHLNYSANTEINQPIFLRISEMEYNVSIVFKVVDVNNNPPYFLREPYIFKTTESAFGGVVIGTVEARDIDSESILHYSITPSEKLSIDDYGVITLKNSITDSDYFAYVNVSDGLFTSQTQIHIKSELKSNETLNYRFTGSVLENTNNSYIATVAAEDHEHFRFFESDAYLSFQIDNKTGNITNIRKFDRENPEERRFLFTIIANKIGDKCSLVVVGKVIITVDDENDNPPEFIDSPYHGEVFENTTNAILELRTPIRTKDNDLNSTVTYKLDDQRFQIDPNTGVIHVNKTYCFDREAEEIPQFVIIVEACDGFNRNTTTVNVTIKDINDNNPELTAENFLAFENATVGTIVSTDIHATDKDIDENGKIRYEISPRGYFQIDENTGNISIGVKLDRETQANHTLTVYAKDRGNPVRTTAKKLLVTVIDDNDESPTFDRDFIQVNTPENNNCSVPIVTVIAHDRDEPGTPNSKILYSLIGNQFDFWINELTGEIYCNKSLDYEKNKTYTLLVKARDQENSTLPDFQTVNVYVDDINDNAPEFSTMEMNMTIRLFQTEKPSRRIVAVVNAIDRDSGENGRIYYNLSGNASEFLTISDRGVIQLNETSKPKSPPYQLIITLVDNGKPSLNSSKNVTVMFTWNGNKKRLIKFKKQEIYMYIEEQSPNGTELESAEKIADLVIHKDCNVAFEMIDKPAIFGINSSTGIIFSQGKINREKQATYDFVIRVKATNSSDLSDLAVIRVHINDTNDNKPEFSRNTYYFRMSESAMAGSVVDPIEGHTNITATDKDEGDNAKVVMEKLNSSELCDSYFNVTSNGDTGYIILVKKVDYEVFKFCKLTVMAFNPNNKSMASTADVSVLINDENDNPPVFHGDDDGVYRMNLSESTSIDNKINVVINVTDEDSRANGEIELNTSDSCWLSFYKNPSGGVEVQLRDNIKLDYESWNKTNTCIIIATDKGSPVLSANATVEINLTDENDNAPKVNYTPIRGNITRFADPGTTVIYKINATDADSGRNKEIEFKTSGSESYNFFEINATSGEIKLKTSLATYDQDLISLLVVVSDKGTHPLSTLVQVTINIIDDNPRPYFGIPTDLDIYEHSFVYYKLIIGDIGQVTAYDKKNDKEIVCTCTYSLETTRDDIKINERNGVISFTEKMNSFDRERELATGGNVSLIVIAQDDGSPPKKTKTNFTIHILDINDQSPVFTEIEYKFSVFQNETDGTVIGTVFAEDLDANPKTIYSINITKSDFESKVIQINDTTGEIYKNGDLMLQNSTNIEIKGTVSAKDGSDTSKPKNNALIVITVIENKNLHVPKFKSDHYNISISWNKDAGDSILHVKANDEDDKNNGGTITYSIIDGNKRGYFGIDHQTGEISLQYPLDSSIGNSDVVSIKLTVEAKDNGFNRKSSTTTVTINIKGENPGECVQGTAHNKQVQRLKKERQNWSYALYGLSGALCISILTTFVFLYKWRSSQRPKQNRNKDKEKYFSNMTLYEDLEKKSRRRETPYSVSNQQFVPSQHELFPSRLRESEQLHCTSSSFGQPRDTNLRSRWDSTDQLSSDQHFVIPRVRNRGHSTEQNSNLRFILERDSDPIPDYLEAISDPVPDYE